MGNEDKKQQPLPSSIPHSPFPIPLHAFPSSASVPGMGKVGAAGIV